MLGDPSYYAYRDDKFIDSELDSTGDWGPFYHRSDLVRLTVTMRPRGETQLVVRASAQYYLKAIEDPEPYQVLSHPRTGALPASECGSVVSAFESRRSYLAPTKWTSMRNPKRLPPHISAASTNVSRHWALTRHCRLTASPARTNRRHWALTVSRPFTNLTCIILHVVNLIILRVVDLHEIRFLVF